MDVLRNNEFGLSGLEQLRAIVTAGDPPPINATMDFSFVEIEEGRVVFEGSPGRSVYNPIGSVHGGYAATLLDSACGGAVHSRLRPGQGFTTLELKIAYHRALSDASGPVRAEGKIVSIGRRTAFAEGRLTDRDGRLCATATSTLLLFEVPPQAHSAL